MTTRYNYLTCQLQNDAVGYDGRDSRHLYGRSVINGTSDVERGSGVLRCRLVAQRFRDGSGTRCWCPKLNSVELYGASQSHADRPSNTGRYSHLEVYDARCLCIRLRTFGDSREHIELIKLHCDRRRPWTRHRLLHMQLCVESIGLCPKLVMWFLSDIL